MKLLAFSDVHTDLSAVERLVDMARSADVVAGVGDFASQHEGLEGTLSPLREIDAPVLLVPGNNETDIKLHEACKGWEGVTVLHGEGADIGGISFFGLGAGVPVTPWGWSFDLTEEEAGAMLERCPEGAVLLSHSPPKGLVDGHDDQLGSEAVRAAIDAAHPAYVLCGHIHESWGESEQVDDTTVINLGPEGKVLEVG